MNIISKEYTLTISDIITSLVTAQIHTYEPLRDTVANSLLNNTSTRIRQIPPRLISTISIPIDIIEVPSTLSSITKQITPEQYGNLADILRLSMKVTIPDSILDKLDTYKDEVISLLLRLATTQR